MDASLPNSTSNQPKAHRISRQQGLIRCVVAGEKPVKKLVRKRALSPKNSENSDPDSSQICPPPERLLLHPSSINLPAPSKRKESITASRVRHLRLTGPQKYRPFQVTTITDTTATPSQPPRHRKLLLTRSLTEYQPISKHSRRQIIQTKSSIDESEAPLTKRAVFKVTCNNSPNPQTLNSEYQTIGLQSRQNSERKHKKVEAKVDDSFEEEDEDDDDVEEEGEEEEGEEFGDGDDGEIVAQESESDENDKNTKKNANAENGSMKPSASTTLLIRDLQPPYHTKDLKELLGTKTDVKSIALSEDKTRCVVEFATIKAAISAHRRLHCLHWPPGSKSRLRLNFTQFKNNNKGTTKNATLEERFHRTKCKPRLYYQPNTPEVTESHKQLALSVLRQAELQQNNKQK